MAAKFECPSSLDISTIPTFFCTRADANECLSIWQVTCFFIPAFAAASLKVKLMCGYDMLPLPDCLVEISKLLGHSNLAATSVYTHTNIEALSEAVNTLNS